MTPELLKYKEELHQDILIGSTLDKQFPEESFFEVTTSLLSEAAILDNVEFSPFKDSRQGMRLDGYSWNELERTFCAVVIELSTDANDIETLTNSELNKIGKRAARFLEKASDPSFNITQDPAAPAHGVSSLIVGLGDELIKFRVVLITDSKLSDRIKSIQLEPIAGRETSIEVWDLERLFSLSESESQTEPFEVAEDLLGGGLQIMSASVNSDGPVSYLGVMPAKVLAAIYDRFGQRLLESNVRTFLDFRGGVNQGLRRSLVTDPDNFFAYNNGITVTADAAKIEQASSGLVLKNLENMQIVNGGQTTAAIYFAPREKGFIKTSEGDMPYRGIDLDRVSVQMKLTVLNTDESDIADQYKANISRFANSQNAVQASDLVSNHPFHLALEKLSRNILIPVGESGIAQKWFYERTRGQYSTKLRALSAQGQRKFSLEYPKSQLFTKTDMAKYENTWRMLPHIVKKGAQANLKALGQVLVPEYEKDPLQFEAAFYKDLVSKAIIFKSVDKEIVRSEWYKAETGLKAEAVTFSIALVRFNLRRNKSDINLETIYKNQKLSSSLLNLFVDTGKIVRSKIMDAEFRGGSGNPSEFCKSENGWKRIQSIEIDTSSLSGSDVVNSEQIEEQKSSKKEINKVSKEVSDYEVVFSLGVLYWNSLADFNQKKYGIGDIRVGIPRKAAQMINGGRVISEKQIKAAIKIREQSESEGFVFANL